ncbi:MAG TPA: type II secretion system protein [Burkholderiales bacterium]|nr:type II secretion system protein [Burkholderiales bacterium]
MRAERGFSLLELLIVTVIISVLVVVAIERLLRLRFEAERVTVQSTIAALKSGLYIEFAAAAAGGQSARIDGARGSNPMLRLAEKPDTYAGEFFGADPRLFQPGAWYFDTRDRALVYLVRFPEQFVTPLSGPPRLRLAVEPDYDDLDRDGRFDPGRDPVRGLKLVPLEPYHWKAQGREQQ